VAGWIVSTVRMNGAIEAFEREFAPWALKLPAADVAARRSGQLRAHGWSVLYEFGSDAYGDYLDYYAALREATDARVNDDWHARIYETGQIVAFPAVLEAYLYGRDPSPDELERARAPVIASLEPPADESSAAIGTADTALWEDLKDVVEAEIPAALPAEPPPPPPPAPAPAPKPVAPAASAPPPRVSVPVRRSAETPAEIANVLDAAFGGAKEKVVGEPRARAAEPKEAPAKEPPAEETAAEETPAKEPPAEETAAEETPAEETAAEETAAEETAAEETAAEETPAEEMAADETAADEPVAEETDSGTADEEPEVLEAPAPRRSAPGYDPFVELRTLEPKSTRRPAPTNDDFRPYWQRYPLRSAGIAAGIAAVVLIAILAMSRSGGSARPARTLADTTGASAPASGGASAADTAQPPIAQQDSQSVPPPDSADTASAPVPPPSATPVSSQSEDNSVARPLGPSSVPQIKRAP
jgi:hypothetical protein